MSVGGEESRAGAPTASPAIDLRACLRLSFEAIIVNVSEVGNSSVAGHSPLSKVPVNPVLGRRLPAETSPEYPRQSMTRRDFSRTAFAVTAANALSASRIWAANDRIRMGL